MVIERYTYDVYGTPRITDAAGTVLTQSAVGNRALFTGREYDQETGLYSYRARYYDSRIGRFLQRDPVGYSAGLNLYSYVGNNPLTFVDPLGLEKTQRFWNALDDFFFGLSNFSAGTSDWLSFGATNYIRERLGVNAYVNKASGLYKAGAVAGFGLGLAAGGAGSFNAGSRTVLYSGKGALQAAQAGKGAGVILEETFGGRALSGLQNLAKELTGNKLPQGVWDVASGIFTGNAEGEVQIFLRSPKVTSVYSRIEKPVLDFFNNVVRTFK